MTKIFKTRPALIGLAVFSWILAGGLVRAQSTPVGLATSSRGFIENRGQWNPAASFRGSFGPMDVWVRPDGFTVAIEERTGVASGPHRSNSGEEGIPVVTTRGVVVRMRFEGSTGARALGEDRLEARHNWFLGNDPAAWVTDVRAYGHVKLPGIYPGVTAVAREESRHFEYDLVLEPGADLAAVRIVCEGQDALSLDETGALVMRTQFGKLRHSAPVAWEETSTGGREPVACAWRIFDDDRCGFEVAGRNPARRLVIDPGLYWSNLFGGVLDEDPSIGAIALSAGGNVNLAGVVVSTTFPVTVGAYQTILQGAGTWDNWVARFSPAGNLLWSTYFGGNGWEYARSVAIGPNDTVTTVGSTSSTNFPFVSGFDSSHNGTGGGGWGDAFLATFNPALAGAAQLTWSTLLGGINDDRLNSVAVDSTGIVTAAGWTYSTDIPGVTPPNAFQPMLQGVQDSIIVRMNPALPAASQLLLFTFLGGSSNDYIGPIAVRSNGQIVVHGATKSFNYPVANPLQMTNAGGAWDTVLTVLDPTQVPASQLVYSTYLGGSGSDQEGGLAVDAQGLITVGGSTNSPNYYATAGAYDTSWNGGFDAYLTRINPSLAPASQIVFSTFIGGTLDDNINDFVVDSSGGVHAVGSSNSPDFPTTVGSYQPAFQGGSLAGYGPYDAIALTLSPTGTALRYSTYIGGAASYEFAYGVASDTCGNVLISGITRSLDFPHTSGIYSNADDVFLLKMDLLPNGVYRYGSSTPGCLGPLEIAVTSVPQNGNPSFGITCAGAFPFASGLLAFSGGALGSPVIASGLAVWVDPVDPNLWLVPVMSDVRGSAVVSFSVPVGPQFIGITGFVQYGWPDICAVGGVSGSCALQITIQ